RRGDADTGWAVTVTEADILRELGRFSPATRVSLEMLCAQFGVERRKRHRHMSYSNRAYKQHELIGRALQRLKRAPRSSSSAARAPAGGSCAEGNVGDRWAVYAPIEDVGVYDATARVAGPGVLHVTADFGMPDAAIGIVLEGI